jgi:hypothetical protein
LIFEPTGEEQDRSQAILLLAAWQAASQHSCHQTQLFTKISHALHQEGATLQALQSQSVLGFIGSLRSGCSQSHTRGASHIVVQSWQVVA